MKHRTSAATASIVVAVAAALACATLPCVTAAQTPPYPQPPTYPQPSTPTPYPPGTYPQQPGYPQPSTPTTYPPATYPQQPAYPQPSTPTTYPPTGTYPQQPAAYSPPQYAPMDPAQIAAAQQQQRAHPIRQMFASTIAMLLNASAGSLVTGVAQGILGAIAGWFGHRSSAPQSAQSYAGAQPYPATYPAATSPYASADGYPQASTAYTPPSTYASTSPAYPTAAPAYPASSTPYATPATGYPSAAYPAPAASYPTASAYPSGAASPPASAPTQANAAYPPVAGYPGSAVASAYGGQPYPSAAAPQGYSQSYPPGTAVQVYDAHTGQLTSAAGSAYQLIATRGLEKTLYAGIAYEVHAVAASGTTTAVNPATHVFHTGDRFLVYYRPSMPGHMDVYNINPSGRRTRIDAATMAAGQLASLGPYEFSNELGDESLRLILAPCTSPQLLVATRDIVNVGATSAIPTPAAIQLGPCDAPASRDVNITARDIGKVAVDDGTAFALDPVSAKELASGQVTPREVTIVFHHR